MKYLITILILITPTIVFAGYYMTGQGTMIETGVGDKEGYIIAEYSNQQIDDSKNIAWNDRSVYEGKKIESEEKYNYWQERRDAWDALADHSNNNVNWSENP